MGSSSSSWVERQKTFSMGTMASATFLLAIFSTPTTMSTSSWESMASALALPPPPPPPFPPPALCGWAWGGCRESSLFLVPGLETEKRPARAVVAEEDWMLWGWEGCWWRWWWEVVLPAMEILRRLTSCFVLLLGWVDEYTGRGAREGVGKERTHTPSRQTEQLAWWISIKAESSARL